MNRAHSENHFLTVNENKKSLSTSEYLNILDTTFYGLIKFSLVGLGSVVGTKNI